MSTLLLPVPFTQQKMGGHCLAACADMVLHYIGRPTRYKRLLKLLKIRDGVGTGFPNISRLEKLGVTVFLRRGTIDQLYRTLQNGHPCITSIKTGELPYAVEDTQHVVVVVGMDKETDTVWVNDPEQDVSPLPVPMGDFDLAWFGMGEKFAVIVR